jgi:hypothetical protein
VLIRRYERANYTSGPGTCMACEVLVLLLTKGEVTVQQLVHHVKIWFSINQKGTCGVTVFAERPLLFLTCACNFWYSFKYGTHLSVQMKQNKLNTGGARDRTHELLLEKTQPHRYAIQCLCTSIPKTYISYLDCTNFSLF